MSDILTPEDAAQMKRHILEHLQVGAQYVARQAEFSAARHFMGEALMLQLRSYVLADKVADDTYERSIPVPASWWQHWKRDKAPAWFLRRWPVAETRVTVSIGVTRYLTYPDASIQTPNLGPAVIQEVVRWHKSGDAS